MKNQHYTYWKEFIEPGNVYNIPRFIVSLPKHLFNKTITKDSSVLEIPIHTDRGPGIIRINLE